ncbi:MAG: amino acid ABC transporter permease [Saccharofermentans sp.]|nr:amino acid ABC transporter permease [Saccharofermentans sp.]
MERYISTITQLAAGFKFTLIIFAFTILFSIPLGLLVAKLRMSKFKVISGITRVYISIMRGTPLMLQLLLVYFLPNMLFGIALRDLNFGGVDYRLTATVIGFSLNYAAYFAEIFRGGIQSIPKGQYEAAQILGFTNTQTFFKIVLPQVIKNVLPAVTNEVITLVKDTSLAQVLSVTEMFTAAKALSSAQVSIMPLIAAGVFYYVMNGLVEIVMNRFEKSMNYYH